MLCHLCVHHVDNMHVYCPQVPPQFAVGTLRLSTGRGTSVEDVDTAVELITQAARKQGMQLSQPSAIS